MNRSALSPVRLAALFTLVFFAQPLQAETTARLIDRTESHRRGLSTVALTIGLERQRATVEPEPAGQWRREERTLIDPVTGEEEIIVLESPAPDLSTRSFLVAIPEGFDMPDSVVPVRVDLFDSQTGELLEEFQSVEAELRPAQVGLVRAGQVYYNLPETDRPVDARLTVELSARTGPLQETRSRIDVPRSVSSLFVNSDDAVVMVPATSRRSSESSSPEPPGEIRISFTKDHRVYRVPVAELGVDIESIDTLRLIHHGNVLPFDVDGEDILFYAARRVTDADTDDSVFVKFVEEDASPRFATRAAFETLEVPAEPTEVEMVRNRRYDWNLTYQPAMSSMPVGSRFAFHRLSYGNTRVHQLPIHDLLTNTFISLRIEFHGRSSAPGFDPDHYANPKFGGVSLQQVTWKGQSKKISNFSFSLPSLPSSPTSTLDFEHAIPADSPVILGGSGDDQYLDLVEVTYLAKPRVENGEFGRIQLAAAGAPRRVTIGGFPAGIEASDVLVLEVTDPNSPVMILDAITFADESGTAAVTFEASSSNSIYHLEHFDNLTSPDSVNQVELMPEALPTDTPLRGIVVRDESYGEAVQPWIEHRGPGIVEMLPQAAYNSFNGGQTSPEAIRQAIAQIIESAPESVAVPFVVLVGHGSFDRRNYLGFKSVPWIPAFLDEGVIYNYNPETQSGTTIENAVDLPIGLLFGDDNLLDVQLTRWPVKSVDDIEAIVTRSLEHDLVADSLVRTDRSAIFIADSESSAFVQDQPVWASIWGQNGFSSVLMTKNQPVPALDGKTNAPAVRFGLERKDGEGNPLGASLVAYVGHGNWDRWANVQIASSLNTSANPALNANVGTFNTVGQWPIVATFTCLNGDYTAPGRASRCLAEAWVVSPGVGAIASISPNGVDYYNEQRLLQGAYLTQLGKPNLADRAATIGEMSHRASVQYATQYPSLMKTLREYIVFGDPLALTTVVPQEADLVVTLESSEELVRDGVPFELFLSVENVGGDEARGLVLGLPLPVGVELIDAQLSWGSFVEEDGTVTFSFGTLIPGQTATATLSVVTTPDSPNPVDLTATAAAVTPDADGPAADSASVIIIRTTETMAIY